MLKYTSIYCCYAFIWINFTSLFNRIQKLSSKSLIFLQIVEWKSNGNLEISGMVWYTEILIQYWNFTIPRYGTVYRNFGTVCMHYMPYQNFGISKFGILKVSVRYRYAFFSYRDFRYGIWYDKKISAYHTDPCLILRQLPKGLNITFHIVCLD